jgi:hypothetical protein
MKYVYVRFLTQDTYVWRPDLTAPAEVAVDGWLEDAWIEGTAGWESYEILKVEEVPNEDI